jgi:hypothetical protein
MNHLSQEQLVEHYYNELEGPREAEIHLASCEECRAEFKALQRVLNTVDGMQVPEPRARFESDVWRKLAPAVGATKPRRIQPTWWVATGAIAAMLAVAFLVGRASKMPEVKIVAKQGAAAQSIPVLVVAVGDHLERAQTVLRELENTETHPGQAVDISYEQKAIEDLLDSNRLYRQSATAEGDLATAGVLEDLENILIEISHQPSKISVQQFEDLRREIKERGILFKATVLGSRLRGEEATL